MYRILYRFYLRFLAFFRLSSRAVCEASTGLGEYDYHDYPDSEANFPEHWIPMTCKRCGKSFRM